jgi:diguanylate cyclase (GGDEF)-like protein
VTTQAIPRSVLSNPLPVFVAAVSATGIAALLFVTATQTPHAFESASTLMWIFFGCVVVGELLPINVVLRGHEGEIVTSTSFAYAMLIAFGVGAAVPALAVASVVADLVRRKPMSRVVFNVGQYTLSLVAGALVLGTFTEVPHAIGSSFMGADLPAILFGAIVFFLVNTGLIATVLAIVQEVPIFRYFVQDFILQASTSGLALGMSPMLVIAGEFSIITLPLLALPLAAVHRGSRQAVINEHQALHDALTGLPNRTLFHDRVTQAVDSARRKGSGAVVMLMDLDHFKEINDTLGHYHGDRLLQLIGERLTDVLRQGDTVARLGGDEFAVLLPAARDRAYATAVAEKILDALRTPFEIDGLMLEVGASIGIACYPEHGDDHQTLVQRADIAMYVAKTDRGGSQLYETEQDQHSVQRLALAGELRRAIENEELVLHYQPQIDVATGRLVGVEALTRWEHPTRGLIMPDEFVPIAEHTGLVTPMTRYVLDKALQQVAAWRKQGLEDISVAVNLCARSFLDGQLLEDIPELLETHSCDASQLALEITESMIVGDPERARSVLEQLSDLGITLAIDDFGTGYSSLAYLRHLPVDEIKIDKSFVLHMADNDSDEILVRSIIDLAHNLNMRAVAEGVEEAQSMARLNELGCDIAQGYHISRPLPVDQLERWAQARNRGPLSATAA